MIERELCLFVKLSIQVSFNQTIGEQLICSIEIQFQRNITNDIIKAVNNKSLCKDLKHQDYCLLPPNLIVLKEKQKSVSFISMNQCAEDIRDKFCPSSTDCMKDELYTGYSCKCKLGYQMTSFKQLADDSKYRTEICEDIDECTSATHNCPQNTTCKNLHGSYDCECKPLYSPKSENIKQDGCKHLCDTLICVHGNCIVSDNIVSCKCNDGYHGINCDKSYKTYIDSLKKVIIAASVLGSLLFIALIFIIIISIRFRKKRKINHVINDAFDERVDSEMHIFDDDYLPRGRFMQRTSFKEVPKVNLRSNSNELSEERISKYKDYY